MGRVLTPLPRGQWETEVSQGEGDDHGKKNLIGHSNMHKTNTYLLFFLSKKPNYTQQEFVLWACGGQTSDL